MHADNERLYRTVGLISPHNSDHFCSKTSAIQCICNKQTC